MSVSQVSSGLSSVVRYHQESPIPKGMLVKFRPQFKLVVLSRSPVLLPPTGPHSHSPQLQPIPSTAKKGQMRLMYLHVGQDS